MNVNTEPIKTPTELIISSFKGELTESQKQLLNCSITGFQLKATKENMKPLKESGAIQSRMPEIMTLIKHMANCAAGLPIFGKHLQ